MEDEPVLIKSAIAGDSRSLAELLRRHYSFLYRYALKLTMDKNRAEDITQETMLKAIEKIAFFQARSKFSTWLIAIASRLAMDRYRQNERERRSLGEQAKLRALRYQSYFYMDEWPDALEAIGALDERQRVVVLLKHYYGYSQEQIASMLEVPTGTVKSRLHAGLKQLRKELAGHDNEKKA